jgi:hypothetical protein
MNTYLLAAGVVAIGVGAIHSLLGEILIFRHLRDKTIVPALSAPPLRERHVRILWASWHIPTVFSWAFAALILNVSTLERAAILAFFTSAILVLIGTKGRHPGWVGLLAVAVLIWLAKNAA